MMVISYDDAMRVLLLQLGDNGRRDLLLGEGVDRAADVVRPFLVGKCFPDVYLEFPLAGDPFLDMTLLYGELEPGTRMETDAAPDADKLLDWFAGVRDEDPSVSFGFELDTKKPDLPAAAVHFQPRRRLELVEPFCQLVGEPERAALYLDQDARMPEGWGLSFFGMFRGRPGSPLRVCGYLSDEAVWACSRNPEELAAVFDAAGFSAYDDAMLADVSRMMALAPGTVDFQLDVFPDGTVGDVFALDVQFEIQQPHLVRSSFAAGPVANVMEQLERWGAADGRWRAAGDAAFARAIPATRDDGTDALCSFTLMPQWAKVRWIAGKLQPSKLYCLAKSGYLDKPGE